MQKKWEDRIPVKSKNLLIRTRDKDILLLDIDRDEKYFSVDKLALKTWNLINAKYSIKRITSTLSKKTGYGVGELTPFVADFVRDLIKEKLVSLKG